MKIKFHMRLKVIAVWEDVTFVPRVGDIVDLPRRYAHSVQPGHDARMVVTGAFWKERITGIRSDEPDEEPTVELEVRPPRWWE